MTISITVLQTGTVAIRPSQYAQAAGRSNRSRLLRVLTDRKWTPQLPIYAYLIEHPEGRFLFDTGESPRASHRGYYPWWNPFFRFALDVRVGEDEGIRARLAERGLQPADLTAVVISHLHCDHGDGLADLVGPPVYLTSQHWKSFNRPVSATLAGAVPQQWPPDFEPTLIDMTGPAIGPWTRSHSFTTDGRIAAVETPGHVPGHLSLVVRGDDVTYLLLGDASYDQKLLDAEITDGINSRPDLALKTLRMIKDFARQEDVVVLPAHDPLAPARLATGEVYRPSSV